MSQEKENELPKSIDLSHHLSELAKARNVSPLKGFFKYYTPDVLALAGGVPHPDYFPFATLEASTLPIDTYSSTPGVAPSPSPIAWLWNLFSSPSAARTDKISVPKYVSDPLNEVNLATSLQYGMAIGVLPLQKFLREYSSTFYRPGFSDFTTLVHTGNTDGWSRVVYSLLNPGDSMLVEEWTYPSALSAALPIGVHSVSVPLDSKGMRPDALRHILSTWDSKARGFNRPRLLYTVPIGQNPSGLTTGEERKRAIYDICVEYDIIIGEDDPYYILQEGEYVAPDVRIKQAKGQKETKKKTDEEEIRAFVDSLEPSYLRYDYQGRVIRLDTFSKTIAPGSRLGWFTCNPIFAERFERAGETSTQAPSGFTQSMVTQLVVKTWGMAGYVRWLRGLRAQYTTRRDTLIDAFCKAMDVKLTTEEYRDEKHEGDVWNGATVWTAIITANANNGASRGDKGVGKKVRVSFVPPTSGMFVWVKVDFSDLSPPIHVPGEEEMEGTHEGRFWTTLAKAGLLILPGWLFRGEKLHAPVDPNKYGHYRISFSDSTVDNMEKASKIFAKTLRDYCSQ